MTDTARNGRDVALVVGAGRIGQAVITRLPRGQHIVLTDRDPIRLRRTQRELRAAGHRVDDRTEDLSQPESVEGLFTYAAEQGPIGAVVHTAGIWPTRSTISAVLRQSLYGTALFIDTCGRFIAPGGVAVVLACLTGHWTDLNDDDQAVLGHIPAADLLDLPFLHPDRIRDPLTAYRITQRAHQLRVRATSPQWSPRAARINSISTGTAADPYPAAALDADAHAGRHGPSVDDIAYAAAYLTGPGGRHISGIDLRIDNGAHAARWSAIDSDDDFAHWHVRSVTRLTTDPDNTHRMASRHETTSTRRLPRLLGAGHRKRTC